MIYNFVEYLKNEFPTEVIYLNGRRQLQGQTSIPDRNVLINDTGGPETPWFQFVRKTAQIITRDKSVTQSRKLSWDIYEKITSVFGLELPLVTVDGTLYNSIKSAQIKGIQEPYYLGDDSEGRPEFTTNYEIIYRRN